MELADLNLTAGWLKIMICNQSVVRFKAADHMCFNFVLNPRISYYPFLPGAHKVGSPLQLKLSRGSDACLIGSIWVVCTFAAHFCSLRTVLSSFRGKEYLQPVRIRTKYTFSDHNMGSAK